MPFVWWQFPAGDDSDEAVRFAAAKAVYRDKLSVRFGLAMDASRTAPIFTLLMGFYPTHGTSLR